MLDNGDQCICISTNVLEAGVDLDFDCGFRSIAGLDSIEQFRGRVNRHGKKPISQVYIFDINEPIFSMLEVTKGRETTLNEIHYAKQYGLEIGSVELMESYFKSYMYKMLSAESWIQKLRTISVSDNVNAGTREYRDIFGDYRAINDDTISVICITETVKVILNNDLTNENVAQNLNRLSGYIIKLRQKKVDELKKASIVMVSDDNWCILPVDHYSFDTGVL